MARERLPLFLARSSYRKRRKMDALKMLAFFGAILWLIPAIWPSNSGGETGTLAMSRALYYIFGVWMVLIVLSFVLTRDLTETEDAAPEADDAL
jgi:hypothetical protein